MFSPLTSGTMGASGLGGSVEDEKLWVMKSGLVRGGVDETRERIAELEDLLIFTVTVLC